MFSMTGYGKGEFTEKNISLVTEIKSVNGKYLDLSCKIPKILLPYEDKIRKVVQSKINRGRVDVYINYTDSSEKEYNVEVNSSLAKSYISAAKELSKSLKVKNDFTVSKIFKLPDIISIKSVDAEENLENAILLSVNTAVDNLVNMRKIEGEKLKLDILNRLSNIEVLVDEVDKFAPEVSNEYAKSLKQRISDVLGDVDYDEVKFLNEIAFFVDKSNIDEEITRLKSHIAQFKDICSTNLGGEGKKLDFLMQEFNRESNTIGSKANNVKITNIVLKLKNEIEKIKEQVQNIE